MDDVYTQALKYHAQATGKLAVAPLAEPLTQETLKLAYTPGVAEPCRVIAKDPSKAYDLTLKGRTIAVISNSSAVLGLGDIGAVAGLPVMEGKALLIKQFADVDAFPLVIDSQDPLDIIHFVKQVAPTFAGINLEDIAAPACFQVEEALQGLGIPVFHDDQHGTAIVVRAALLNAAQVVGKPFDSLKVIIVGAGAAGLAIARMLLGLHCLAGECNCVDHAKKVGDVIVVDSQGALVAGRSNQNIYKQAIAGLSNKHQHSGNLDQVINQADVVIGVSRPGTITPAMIQTMAPHPIVFALANPTPEVMPADAKASGAAVVATGRSDYANQINNVLAFPGIFRAVVQGRLTTITHEMKHAASDAIAQIITHPTADQIIPSVFHPDLATTIAEAVLSTKIIEN
jgi:malate dehydrogenase (oxaloacetate-decarboxylating)